MKRIAAGAVTLCLIALSCSQGDTTPENPQLVRVAVAANFAATHEELARQFHEATGITVETSLNSTGQLYAQIQNGAPYDVFLAADVERPRLLEETNAAVPGSRFAYAVGQLVLYAPTWDSVRSGEIDLLQRDYQHLAVANPLTAPYGTAARQVLERLNMWTELQDRIVQGESVGQVLQFVHSGAVEVGFVALSQVISLDATEYWIIPDWDTCPSADQRSRRKPRTHSSRKQQHSQRVEAHSTRDRGPLAIQLLGALGRPKRARRSSPTGQNYQEVTDPTRSETRLRHLCTS